MSFDWGSRPTDYGRGGDIDMDLVYNDPRFATAVTEAIKQSPTMRSAFPHSSIDPRAIYPVQRVTTLPNARERYDGLEVEYYPSGSAASQPAWRLVWSSVANSGSGAWMCIGGGMLYDLVATPDSTTSTANYADLVTDGPLVAVAVDGDYEVYFSSDASHSAINGVCYIAPGGTSYTAADSASAYYQAYTATSNGGISRVRVLPLSVGNLKLQYKTSSGTATYSNRFIAVRPIELRPEG